MDISIVLIIVGFTLVVFGLYFKKKFSKIVDYLSDLEKENELIENSETKTRTGGEELYK